VYGNSRAEAVTGEVLPSATQALVLATYKTIESFRTATLSQLKKTLTTFCAMFDISTSLDKPPEHLPSRPSVLVMHTNQPNQWRPATLVLSVWIKAVTQAPTHSARATLPAAGMQFVEGRLLVGTYVLRLFHIFSGNDQVVL
jgi:hypothetical protein